MMEWMCFYFFQILGNNAKGFKFHALPQTGAYSCFSCTAGARRGFHLVRRLHLNSEVVVGRAGAWCILGATRPLSQDQREEGV